MVGGGGGRQGRTILPLAFPSDFIPHDVLIAMWSSGVGLCWALLCVFLSPLGQSYSPAPDSPRAPDGRDRSHLLDLSPPQDTCASGYVARLPTRKISISASLTAPPTHLSPCNIRSLYPLWEECENILFFLTCIHSMHLAPEGM